CQRRSRRCDGGHRDEQAGRERPDADQGLVAMKIGVLALQGDFDRHAKALARCGVSRSEEIQAVEVRKPAELADVDGLIIPGGESTTLLKLMEAWGFVPALEKFHAEGRPIFGTCAGLILLARDVDNPRQFSLEGPAAARRNRRVIYHDVYTNVPAAEIDRFVRAQELGRLVTVGADGTPHLGLYPFTYDGEAFEIHLVRSDEQIADLAARRR